MSDRLKRKVQVRVSNPPHGGSAVMSLYHAERHVKRGRARFDAMGAVVLLPHAMRETPRHQFNPSDRGYDEVRRMMTLPELANIPVVNPSHLIAIGRSALR